MIRAIVAIDDKNGLAKGKDIPWDIPADKQYFRDKTLHSTVVMGHATAELFAEPLPDRHNVVVSSNREHTIDGFELIYNLPVFLQTTEGDIWIVGGAKIYEVALPYCQELYITRVKGDFGCDKFFPDFRGDFKRQSQPVEQTDNGYQFTYEIHTKSR